MGRIRDIFFGKPVPPLPPIEDERVHLVIEKLSEHKATIASRAPITTYAWQRWTRSLAEDIVTALDEKTSAR